MDNFKKVVSQTWWQVLGKVVTSLATLLLLSFVTRTYGASGTGLYTLVLTYLAFFYLPVDAGLNAHFLPAFQQDGVSRLFSRLLGLRLVLAGVFTALALLLLPLLPFAGPTFSLMVLLGAVTIFGFAVFVSANVIFQSRLLYRYSILATIISAVLSTIGSIVFIILGSSIVWVIIPQALGWIICGAISLYFVGQIIKVSRPEFDRAFLLQSLRQVWPVTLTLMVNTIYFRADSFILSSVRPLDEVGVYNLAYQLFQSALVLPTFIMNGYYPLLLKSLESQLLVVKKLMLPFGLLVGLGLIGTIVTWWLSPSVVPLISGNSDFSGSVDALRILAVGFPAFFGSSLLMWVLVALRRYKSLSVIYVAGLGLNIILNLIFIPQYSYIASSWITTSCEYLILTAQILILLIRFKSKF